MLPEKFLEEMKQLLGNQFENYLAAMNQKPSKAVRVNGVKTDDASFLCHFPYPCKEIGNHEYSVSIDESDRIGNLPLHHAGAFYSQEPSAMFPVRSIPFSPGFKVLDACASPGGKSIQAAMEIPDGFLVSNEYVSSRAVTLMGNIERMGIRNALVTNTDTRTLAEWYENVFDAVICDAPCSGEGMFRKNPDTIGEWSPENVTLCARRQSEILDNVSGCVRENGYLVYSTCTFSREENEETVLSFLSSHPDFVLSDVPEELKKSTLPGIGHPEMRRFYPFSGNGEGQFFALLKRISSPAPAVRYADSARNPDRKEREILLSFLRSCMDLEEEPNLKIIGNMACIAPDFPVPPHSVFVSGVKIGTIEKGRVIPHHQLFSAYGKQFRNRMNLSGDGEEIKKYIEGNTLPTDLPDGWTAVLCDGVPLGGGKAVGGILKNHYPKGLRKSL